jgi:hypothetical protein
MAEPGPVTRALRSLDGEIGDERELARQVCRACVDGLAIDGAAISLHTTSNTLRETLYAGDAIADLLEELQFSLGEGPCMEAARTGHPVLVPDLTDVADTGRWPMYAAAVVEDTGICAVFALPLQWGTVNLGVLDLYRRSAGSLSPAQRRDAVAAADLATLMLLGRRTDPGDPRSWDDSWGGRAEIHQATGMVGAQLGVGVADAFARLRAHAFAERRLLVDVAADVVTRRLRFSPHGAPR